MVSITVGSGSSFKSSTAEQHLLEICTYLQIQEKSLVSNPTSRDFMQITYNLNDMTTGISFAIPADQSISTSGQVLINANEYLQGITFTPGDGGTFKSPTLSQYFYEVVTFLQIKESNTATNPQTYNHVLSAYDADDKLITGTISLPISVTINSNGKAEVSAVEYLL